MKQVQERLRRPILVENLSAYLRVRRRCASPSRSSSPQLCARTGCGLLLDVNNLVVNALNRRDVDPLERVPRASSMRSPPGVVGEIHLAGYARRGAIW